MAAAASAAISTAVSVAVSATAPATAFATAFATASATRQEKIYQHFPSIWQHLAAKRAIRALCAVAYGLDQGAANCHI